MIDAYIARHDRAISITLLVLLILCVIRLWLMPMGSSFWIDEMATAFVVHHGGAHPSFAIAPQVPYSIYYGLPKVMDSLFGTSEIAYRIPSLLAMGVAISAVAFLASKLIHPGAAWLAVFACFGLRGINYMAADARPYALGVMISAIALVFLVRWFNNGSWRDALIFAVFASLLWRVHLIFWPFYFAFGIYIAVRLIREGTRKLWSQAAVVLMLTGVLMIPVLFDALALLRQAKDHVIVDLPSWRDLRQSLKFGLILPCGIGSWIIARMFRSTVRIRFAPGAIALILAWWLCQPIALYAFSRLTGNSVFVPRYLFLSLPGAAMAAAAAAAYFLPSRYLKPAALLLGLGVLVGLGQWRQLWPPHHNSDWRLAERKVAELHLSPETPVIYPSPFIEARPPVWQPDYPLPGFLYSHLDVYRPSGRPYLFPFEDSPQAEMYAHQLVQTVLAKAGRFTILGGDRNVWFWRDWFARRAELSGWRCRKLGPFGDVEAVVFERP